MTGRLHQHMNNHCDNAWQRTLHIRQCLTAQRHIIIWLQCQVQVQRWFDQSVFSRRRKVTRGVRDRLRNGCVLNKVVSRVEQTWHHATSIQQWQSAHLLLKAKFKDRQEISRTCEQPAQKILKTLQDSSSLFSALWAGKSKTLLYGPSH